MKTRNEELEMCFNEVTMHAVAAAAYSMTEAELIATISDTTSMLEVRWHATRELELRLVARISSPLIDYREAAAILGISPETMSNYGTPSGGRDFPVQPVRQGHRVRWDRAEIEAVAAQRNVRHAV
jgi:predicted DNA-binding transcriptional regulator AlpA